MSLGIRPGTQAANINRIEASDGGDGSTFLTIEFDDGSQVALNPDIPYDGEIVWEKREEGIYDMTFEEGD